VVEWGVMVMDMAISVSVCLCIRMQNRLPATNWVVFIYIFTITSTVTSEITEGT
jgi:hypothetical protein